MSSFAFLSSFWSFLPFLPFLQFLSFLSFFLPFLHLLTYSFDNHLESSNYYIFFIGSSYLFSSVLVWEIYLVYSDWEFYNYNYSWFSSIIYSSENILVIKPIILVLPSLNRTVCPSYKYSGLCINRNRTSARSPFLKESF